MNEGGPNLFTRLLRPSCYSMTLACHAIMKTCHAIMLTCNATTNMHEHHQSWMGVANRMTQVATCLACWHAFLGSWSSSAFASSLIKRENWKLGSIDDLWRKNRRRVTWTNCHISPNFLDPTAKTRVAILIEEPLCKSALLLDARPDKYAPMRLLRRFILSLWYLRRYAPQWPNPLSSRQSLPLLAHAEPQAAAGEKSLIHIYQHGMTWNEKIPGWHDKDNSWLTLLTLLQEVLQVEALDLPRHAYYEGHGMVGKSTLSNFIR